MREIAGVSCLQLEDFDAAAARQPEALGISIACTHCQARLLFVEFIRAGRVLQFRCANCNAAACSPVIPEAASAAGGEVPIVTAPTSGGLQ